jgi:hypothetical protein
MKRRGYVSAEERVDQALQDLWDASREIYKRSQIGWGDDDGGDPFPGVMLTFAKQIYGFICASDASDDDCDTRSDEHKKIAADIFEELVERLRPDEAEDENVVPLAQATTA